MKLSNETREVLKNFASINSNLLVKAGNKIATMSAMRNIVALATIEETFEREFAIYDLNEFLAALSLFKKPVLDFKEKYMMIAEEGSKKSIKYYYTPNDMVTEPKSDLHMPETDVEFVLTHDEFVNIQRAAAVLGVPDLVMNAEVTGEVELSVIDRKNSTSNTFSLVVADNATKNLVSNFKTENLKLLPDDYTVKVAQVGISHFKSKDRDVEYFIALETH